MSFHTALLAEVCEITMGQAPTGDTYNTDGEGLPLIAGAGDFGDLTPEVTKFTTSPTKVSRPGDIILCIRATIGDRNWADAEYCLGRGVAGLSGRSKKLDQRYLWHWIGHATPILKAKGRGATFLQVNKADIGSLEIPLPSLPEQRRIAATLDKADALRAKRREAIAKLDQLLQSVFLNMFDRDEFEQVPVGELVASTQGSLRTGPFGSQLLHSEFVESGVPVLGIDNAVSNEFQWAKARFISEEKYQSLARYRVHPGDLLITIMGTCGRCAVVPDDIPVAINTKHLCCITLDRKRCEPEFLHSYFLIHNLARKHLMGRAKGAIMEGLNMGVIKELPVALPSIEQQQIFVAIKRAIRRTRARACEHGARIQQLFESLQQRAFEGAL